MIRAGQRFPLPHPNQRRFVVATGEVRPPKKWEWFLSGAIVEAYEAFGDHPDSDPRPIAKLEKP